MNADNDGCNRPTAIIIMCNPSKSVILSHLFEIFFSISFIQKWKKTPINGLSMEPILIIFIRSSDYRQLAQDSAKASVIFSRISLH